MRSLAAHFVQGKDKMPYIFHPCYDMRERFVDLNALQVCGWSQSQCTSVSYTNMGKHTLYRKTSIVVTSMM